MIRGINFVVIREDGKFLIQKRDNKENIGCPGEYSFPGGRLNKNEETFNAVARECFEETKIILKEIKPLFYFTYRKNGILKINLFFVSFVKNPEVISSEGKFYWFTFKELESIKLAYYENKLLPIIKRVLGG